MVEGIFTISIGGFLVGLFAGLASKFLGHGGR